MKSFLYIFLILFVPIHCIAQESEYNKNLKIASDLFLSKKKIPNNILLKLVPENDSEFVLFYGTTSPDSKIANTQFFEITTQLIFDQLIKHNNEAFYLLCLQLASFADGEFADLFRYNLEAIIKQDKIKFCESIKGKRYTAYNPMKYYAVENCK